MKLWLLVMMTSLPPCAVEREKLGLPVVDDVIVEAGDKRAIPHVGFETTKDQIAALEGLSDADAAILLASNAAHPEMTADAYVTMLRLYRQESPARILPIIDAMPVFTQAERDAQARFLTLMLARNATMVEKALPMLSKGGAFIAVGALHLPGRQGLIERFRAAGYDVTKVQ